MYVFSLSKYPILTVVFFYWVCSKALYGPVTNCEAIHQSSRTKCIEDDKAEYYKCYSSVF